MANRILEQTEVMDTEHPIQTHTHTQICEAGRAAKVSGRVQLMPAACVRKREMRDP